MKIVSFNGLRGVHGDMLYIYIHILINKAVHAYYALKEGVSVKQGSAAAADGLLC